ncbi:MAG: A/G-specific adenine glycosylase [Magnetococcales bacterium]|nr:A/G-specific adenine glycosylase [Magnetococcales bacterium]
MAESPLSQLLLEFYDQNGRFLPWRNRHDPYAIWISEVMLQQTGVAAVIPYYDRFMQVFPTLQSLAQASLEQVLFHWQGLGYYQRARRLHQTAQIVVEQHGGILPQQLDQLMALPGIGRNTACAILAIAFNHPYAILDGNVKRVLTRLMAIDSPLDHATTRRLWQLAQQMTSPQRPGDYAQAIMDLGATLCTPRQPQCQRCPWQDPCQARKTGDPQHYPVTVMTGSHKPHRWQLGLLLLRPDGSLLLLQRPGHGLLAGLWQPLCGPLSSDPPDESAVATMGRDSGLVTTDWHVIARPLRHTFTHFHLTLLPWQGRWLAGDPDAGALGYQSWCWASVDEASRLPMATLHRKLLQMFGWSLQPAFHPLTPVEAVSGQEGQQNVSLLPED